MTGPDRRRVRAQVSGRGGAAALAVIVATVLLCWTGVTIAAMVWAPDAVPWLIGVPLFLLLLLLS